MDFDFQVTPEVLIPRPETELLVEKLVQAVGHSLHEPKKGVKVLPWTAKEAEETEEPEQELKRTPYDEAQVLDMGTGSGAIICSLLALVPTLSGTALDKSRAALAVARANAAHLGADSRVNFLESDMWAAVPRGAAFNIIVSNPPYIPAREIENLAADVQKEPHMALDGGADGLDFYRTIIAGAGEHLLPGGLLAFEIGYDQGPAVAELCREAGFADTLVLKDYADLDRMVFAAAPGSELFANVKNAK